MICVAMLTACGHAAIRSGYEGRVRPGVLGFFALLLAGCSTEPADGHGPSATKARAIATPDRWQMEERAGDPLASEAPLDAGCDPYAALLEGSHLEIDMRACTYVVLGQPALTAAAHGERLTGPIWHLGLVAELPATAHVALALAGSVIWEERVAIPSPPSVWSLDIPLGKAIEQGAAVVFHLHNHGSNQWRVGELRVEP